MKKLYKIAKVLTLFVFLPAVLILCGLAAYELHTNHFQAKYFSDIAAGCTYQVSEGPSSSIRFPVSGPFNERRGYTLIPSLTELLKSQGFEVMRQAVWTEEMVKLFDQGINPLYQEKKQAGLHVYEKSGRAMPSPAYSAQAFNAFDEVPPILTGTLLFIEDRHLLDTAAPCRNPAIDWRRFAWAGYHWARSKFRPESDVPGASTLATQLEKFRYSPGGMTSSPEDKLQQMMSASLRAYLEGEQTMERRKDILVDYINGAPLAAFPGYGEVNGLGEGLFVWYGASLDTLMDVLAPFKGGSVTPAGLSDSALSLAGHYYRMALSLFIAHRRPHLYLVTRPELLDDMAERHLQILRKRAVIPEPLALAALNCHPRVRRQNAPGSKKGAPGFVPLSKAANVVRTPMLRLLNLSSLYDLDRLDISAESQIDGDAQIAISGFFNLLSRAEALDSLGMRGFRLMRKGDPKNVIYSFTLYERGEASNYLRVQVDSYNNPLNMNEGSKLDLGSTAKLRTLATYLEAVETARRRFLALSREELKKAAVGADDEISKWMRSYILIRGDTSLPAVLDAALQRSFSANPRTKFFTGGGLHEFVNFNPQDNHKRMPVRDALTNSVNLVFIRLMKEVVNYHINQLPGVRPLLTDSLARSDSLSRSSRQALLKKFCDYEGKIYLNRFYRQLRTIPSEALADSLIAGIRPSPGRIAAIYCAMNDSAEKSDLAALLKRHGFTDTTDKKLDKLIRRSATRGLSISDHGYLAGIHPLKLLAARALYMNPVASFQEIFEAARPQMENVYGWLLKSRKHKAQDKRIRMVLEMDAFAEIHKSWKRLGYPFDELVPSYATALGASADRPSALAELAGIVLNDGIRKPRIRVNSISFAQGTPFETILRRTPAAGERVMSQEVAGALRACLFEVVNKGTAARARNAFADCANPLSVGGKTGTGDHRYKYYDVHGKLLREEIRNRTATFVFIIGDRFFGSLSVIVPGSQAGAYEFTSSYAAEIFKRIAPSLKFIGEAPVVAAAGGGAGNVTFSPF